MVDFMPADAKATHLAWTSATVILMIVKVVLFLGVLILDYENALPTSMVDTLSADFIDLSILDINMWSCTNTVTAVVTFVMCVIEKCNHSLTISSAEIASQSIIQHALISKGMSWWVIYGISLAAFRIFFVYNQHVWLDWICLTTTHVLQ